MKKRLLIGAFACLASMAIAQSSTSQTTSSTKETKPRDLATGQASGKTASPRGGQAGRESSAASVSELTVTKPGTNGRESSAPSISELTVSKPTTNRESSQPSVSEVTAQASSDTIAGNHKKGWDPEPKRDIVGKAEKDSNGQPRVATGDVNGDGKADAAINNSHSNIKNSKDLATGQASGKRQHEPVTFQKEAGTTSPAK